jgi:hypothetical protein
MSKAILFTYTKPNGDISERTALVIQKPTDNYSMLDITDLDETERSVLESRLEEYFDEVRELRAELGLNSFWKNFKESRMTDIQEVFE